MAEERNIIPPCDPPSGSVSEIPPDRASAVPWYAIWVMSRAEFVVSKALTEHGIEAYAPTWRERNEWSDRVKYVDRPLFPGYLFAAMDAEQRAKALRIAGVIQLMPNSLHPEPIEAAEIENIRRVAASGLRAEQCVYVTGDEVVVQSGPLAGARGIVQHTKQSTRVIVRMEMLRRAVQVEISAEDLAVKKPVELVEKAA
jgi:transcription antitermination factor NusG